MINMIVAVSKNGVIGKNGELPWRLPEDLKSFKLLTMGSILYAGKITAKTLPPLKGREIRILNREAFPSLTTISSYHMNDENPVWIIGGAAIYNAALELDIVDKVYLSIVEQDFDGDTFFSIEQFKPPRWSKVNETILRESNPVIRLQEWINMRVW